MRHQFSGSKVKFPQEIVWQVWSKGYIISVLDAPVWRRDGCGAWIRRTDYEDRNSAYGWVIDNIIPKSQGGTNEISNLRPLHWENTVRRRDDLTSVERHVTALGTENVKVQ